MLLLGPILQASDFKKVDDLTGLKSVLLFGRVGKMLHERRSGTCMIYKIGKKKKQSMLLFAMLCQIQKKEGKSHVIAILEGGKHVEVGRLLALNLRRLGERIWRKPKYNGNEVRRVEDKEVSNMRKEIGVWGDEMMEKKKKIAGTMVFGGQNWRY